MALNLPTLSFAQGVDAVCACLRARRAPYLLGPPGVGKTHVIRAAAAKLGLPCVELIGSTLDPTDVAGIPWVRHRDDGADLVRQLCPEIRQAILEPVVLFLDELTACPSATQAPLLRLILERKIGDAELHPVSVIAVAGNPPDQCPSGVEISAATINRMVPLRVLPTLDELCAYYGNLGEEDSTLMTLGLDVGATLRVEAQLVAFDPPAASVDGGEPWASPRAWETGLRAYAQVIDAGLDGPELSYAILAGAVGPAAATAYSAIRKLRAELPSVDDIVANPDTAAVPAQRDRQVAALGLLAAVARKDVWPAWTYASRLIPEIAMACTRILLTFGAKASPHGAKIEKEGKKARIRLLEKIAGNLRGVDRAEAAA